MHRVVVIGAGIGGLSAALDLARCGIAVTVVESASAPGGKMREITLGDHRIDSGPTVFTMKPVFERLFADADAALDEHLTIRPVDPLARHAWTDGSRLDLCGNRERDVDAIAAFADRAEADRYLAFCGHAERIFRTLDSTFMREPNPGLMSLIAASGLRGLADLWQLKPFRSLWRELGRYFRDPRLRSLFARYATYSGASPLHSPATLMLIAHVEQCGVWRIEGGMQRLAEALVSQIRRHRGEVRFDATVDDIGVHGGRVAGVRLADGQWLPADAVIANVDAAQIAAGGLGEDARVAVPSPAAQRRSLSAVTWSLVAKTSGFDLAQHNVFFPDDYPREFREIFGHRRLPEHPAVYVCAGVPQVSNDGGEQARGLFMIANAPADGDHGDYDEARLDPFEHAVFRLLERCGLRLEGTSDDRVVTTPADFEKRFPGTGGALYGAPPHGWRASFARPTARSRVAGLYLAGGSAHPGPGVPMVALSGRFAARAVAQDFGVDI